MATAPSDAELLGRAQEAAHNAYVPYSGFPVGAAVLTGDGRVVTGCNVENASYGLTICAERNAITTMVATDPDDRIVKIAVFGPKAAPCQPCGACRQVMSEFGKPEVIVEVDGEAVAYPFSEILPNSFDLDAQE